MCLRDRYYFLHFSRVWTHQTHTNYSLYTKLYETPKLTSQMNTRDQTVSRYTAEKEILCPHSKGPHARDRETIGRQKQSLIQTLLH